MNVFTPALTLSDDGRRLLYTRSRGYSSAWAFERTDPDGDAVPEPRRLSRGTAPVRTPRLSPDGRTVAYVERGDLYVQPFDGREARRRLTFFEQGVSFPAWSPDGNRLAFVSAEGGRNRIWLIERDGGGLRDIEPEPDVGVYQISWAGEQAILYTTGDQTGVRVIDTETLTDRSIVSREIGTWWYEPLLSPDASTVAVHRVGPNGLWLIDLQSGIPTSLSSPYSDARPIGWSGDGQSVFGMRMSTNEVRREIYRFDRVSGTAELHLTLPPGQPALTRDVTISADGRRVVAAVSVASTDVWLVEGFGPSR